MQTKKQSLFESMINIMVGYLVALLSQLMIFPLFGLNLPFSDNLLIGLWFTIISIVRSYTLRRYFNRKHQTNPNKSQFNQHLPADHWRVHPHE